MPGALRPNRLRVIAMRHDGGTPGTGTILEMALVSRYSLWNWSGDDYA
jgi:hypothetical protein